MLRAVRLLCHMVHAEGRVFNLKLQRPLKREQPRGEEACSDPTHIIWLSTRLLTAVKVRWMLSGRKTSD